MIAQGWSRLVSVSRHRFTARLLAISARFLTLFIPAAQLCAQTAPVDPVPPPSISTTSPGDVDLASGTFSAAFDDLSIGGPDGSGLRFQRSYKSGTAQAFSVFAGFSAQGWSHNWAMRISMAEMPEPAPEGLDDPACPYPNGGAVCEDITKTYFHSVVAGGRSLKFINVTTNGNGNNVGSYYPIDDTANGNQLIFVGDHYNGHFTFIDRGGAIYEFNSLASGGARIKKIVHPDGTVEEVQYSASGGPRLVTNSRGYAMLFEYGIAPSGSPVISRACVVNTSRQQVSAGSNCPADAQAESFGYNTIAVVYNREGKTTATTTRNALVTSTNAAGAQTAYNYDDGGHVDCVIQAGENACQIRNFYSECIQDREYYPSAPNALYPEMHLAEQVIRQEMGSGERLTYGFANTSPTCPPDDGDFFLAKTTTTWFENGTNERYTTYIDRDRPASVTDPLGRVVEQSWSVGPNQTPASSAGLLLEHVFPEGNRQQYDYDDRGNQTLVRAVPKSGSGQSVLASYRTFPATCANTLTCNEPTGITDARGGTTNFTYDGIHGGILKKTLPAGASGVRPETRYNYGQKYAWLKSGSGFIQSVDPVWLLVSEEYCRTSAADANGNCAAGAADEVVTTYQYEQGGPSKGSNALLVGFAVAADGQTLRTCYGYDALSRKISETAPSASLATCP